MHTYIIWIYKKQVYNIHIIPAVTLYTVCTYVNTMYMYVATTCLIYICNSMKTAYVQNFCMHIFFVLLFLHTCFSFIFTWVG